MLKISFTACLFAAVVLARFTISGRAADLEPAQLARLHRALEPLHKQFDHSALVRSGDLCVGAVVAHAALGGLQPRCEAGHDNDRQWIDVILYSGSERDFDFNKIQFAAVGFALQISTDRRPEPVISIDRADDRLALRWENLALQGQIRPGRISELQKSFTVPR